MSFQNEEIIRFVTAIFTNPALFSKTYTIGNVSITFRLPTFNDHVEIKNILTEEVANKVIKSTKLFRLRRAMLRMASMIQQITINGSVAYSGNGTLTDRATLLGGVFKTEATYLLVRRLTQNFMQYYQSLLQAVSSENFFDDMNTPGSSSA